MCVIERHCLCSSQASRRQGWPGVRLPGSLESLRWRGYIVGRAIHGVLRAPAPFRRVMHRHLAGHCRHHCWSRDSARLRRPRAGSGSFRTASSRVEIKFRDSWLRALGEVACDSFVPFARQSACGIGSMVESFARSRRFFQLLVGLLCRLRLE